MTNSKTTTPKTATKAKAAPSLKQPLPTPTESAAVESVAVLQQPTPPAAVNPPAAKKPRPAPASIRRVPVLYTPRIPTARCPNC